MLSPRDKQGDSPRSPRDKTSREGGHGGLGERVAHMRFEAELHAATAPKSEVSRDSTNADDIMAKAVMAH